MHILTELLLDMVNVADLEELSIYLNNKNALHIVKLAHHLSALERNNQTIQTAISKASKVVFSLKNFSHHDMSGNKILSNINYGIKTVLVLYQNFLKQGCNVVENYADLPDIFCYPDELNQVWTNLIHNALYAMQNVGMITIDTKIESNMIVVCITDDGSGIPKDIQEKVFTSFFTTKPAGEGSGLGLGICKRIIDKHEGDITLLSQPGKTTFTVKLPMLES
ncbi:MAG: two-component system NtrC family sensor kinase [Oleiphilaceae bacterium]